VITDLIPSPLIKQLKAGGRMVIPDRWREFSGNKPRDNRLLSHLRVLFSLLAQENSPDEVSGLQTFLCPSEGKNSARIANSNRTPECLVTSVKLSGPIA